MKENEIRDHSSEHAAAGDLEKFANPERMDPNVAFNILQKVNEQYRGNTYDIPLDEYPAYLKAAEDFLASISVGKEKPTESNIQKLAERIIKEAPKDLKAA